MDDKRFTARVLEKIDNGKGYWNCLRVGVFDGETRVGEYTRNYPSFAERTFFAFEQAGAWYALYSKDYTATRLMRLPECADIGGEERHAGGFCPVEYYVPELCGRKWPGADDPKPPPLAPHRAAWDERHPFINQFATFGFVAGCVWGDDNSWKVQCLDLSRASEGVVLRDERFGYLELPSRVSLADAIRVDCNEYLDEPLEEMRVRIATTKLFTMTGKLLA